MRVAEVGGAVIHIYPRGEHPPPHVHISTSSGAAVVRISDGSVMQGKASAVRAASAAIEWIKESSNRKLLQERWVEITKVEKR